jgi:LPXTG-site transpeptidase (sortase) family protein
VSQRLLPGLFALTISLALVGAAVTATDRPEDSLHSDRMVSWAVPASAASAEAATAKVPLRSADLDSQVASARSGVTAAPIAVRAESLGLQADVLSVGVDENNQFDVPEAQKVGWYMYGSAPGSAGSTVLAAHVDYAGKRGAFFNLRELAVGELLEVELADGSLARYRVIDNTLYDKTALPADELFRKDGDEVLRLITCGGEFDRTKRSYVGNQVVTAEPVDI